MNLGEKIRKGARWLLLGNVGNRVLKFAYGIVLARLLFPADFGMMVTLGALTGFAGMFVSAGMGQSLIRAKEVDEGDFTAVFTMQLAIGTLVYLVFFLTAPWIGEFFEDSLYTDLVRITALTFLLRPFGAVRGSLLSREMDFRRRAIVTFSTAAFTGTVSIVMAFQGMGVWSLVLSGLAGAFFSNALLAWVTRLPLRLNLDAAKARKHSGFGLKITVNDFLSYLSRESKNLIISKLAGPAFLGLFNKADSMRRMPNETMMPAAMQPVFRALSQVQDDLDQSRYIYYRAITLLMVYTSPFYVGLWWLAEPFIGVVYGEKWIAAAEPIRILVLAGFFLNVLFPSARLLDAQNRLGQEMVVLVVRLAVVVAAVTLGLRWGLAGVAWGLLGSEVLTACLLHLLAARAVHGRPRHLVAALTPGLALNAALFGVLAVTDLALGNLASRYPAVYLLVMSGVGGAAYAGAFMFFPIPAIRSEVDRWRRQLGIGLGLLGSR